MSDHGMTDAPALEDDSIENGVIPDIQITEATESGQIATAGSISDTLELTCNVTRGWKVPKAGGEMECGQKLTYSVNRIPSTWSFGERVLKDAMGLQRPDILKSETTPELETYISAMCQAALEVAEMKRRPPTDIHIWTKQGGRQSSSVVNQWSTPLNPRFEVICWLEKSPTDKSTVEAARASFLTCDRSISRQACLDFKNDFETLLMSEFHLRNSARGSDSPTWKPEEIETIIREIAEKAKQNARSTLPSLQIDVSAANSWYRPVEPWVTPTKVAVSESYYKRFLVDIGDEEANVVDPAFTWPRQCLRWFSSE